MTAGLVSSCAQACKGLLRIGLLQPVEHQAAAPPASCRRAWLQLEDYRFWKVCMQRCLLAVQALHQHQASAKSSQAAMLSLHQLSPALTRWWGG